MDIKIEVINVPVTDVDVAKSFYVDKIGLNEDIDIRVSEGLRFVQLTPPGSACSIVIGEGLTDMEPGSQRGIMAVINNADESRARLIEKGVDASEVDEQEWGRFVYFADPDGNAWTLQQLPDRSEEPPDATDEQLA
jgi:catechol 2,3-dioxygenase-like lactoylglutathione lyase family enzyme